MPAGGGRWREEVATALFHLEQAKKMLARASETKKKKGRTDDDRRSFRESSGATDTVHMII